MHWPKFQLPLIRGALLILCRSLIGGVSLASFAQLAEQTNQSALLTIPAREALAKQILVHAEIASAASDPTNRALVLYRTAGGWLALDSSHSIRLYRDSFSAARESTVAIRERLEDAILNELLPLSPSDVLDLLPKAESATKNRYFSLVIVYWLLQGDYPKAVGAFESAIGNGILPDEYPDEGTSHLLATLPTRSSAERTRVFSEVIRYCQGNPSPARPTGQPCGSLVSLVARFYAQMPPTLVREAVHTVLALAEQQDHQHPVGGSFGGAMQFHSNYDYQLFAVAHALQAVDQDQAAALFAQHPEAAEALKRFPEGPYDLSRNLAIIPNHQKPMELRLWSNAGDALNLLPQDIGLEFTVPRPFLPGVTGTGFPSYDQRGPEAPVLDQLKTCPADTPQRLEQLALTVPIVRQVPMSCSGGGCSHMNTFPRPDLFQFLATVCINFGGPAAARGLLHSQIALIKQMPEDDRADYLVGTADLYLRLGDRDAAADVSQEGFKLARAMYEHELTSDYLEKFAKGFWNSAEIYRQMITLGVNASLDGTRKAVDEIPDANLREIEQVMIARALLGVPIRRQIIANPRAGL